MTATDVRLLGPIEVTLDGRPVELGATKQRALLAMLALRPNAVVPVDELVDGLWGERPPASAVKLIQHYVSQLRKLLSGGDAEIVTRGRGYELRVRPDAVDVAGFERLAEAAARGQGNGTAAREALSLWRGSPLMEVIDEPFAAPELRRLEELWLNVTEQIIAPDHLDGVDENAVGRIDTRAGDVVAQYLVGREPRALATGAGSVWIADAKDGTVSRLEPGDNRVTTIPVGSDPVALAYGGGALWGAESGDRTVAQISPESNKVTQRIEIANAPSAIAVGYGSVWVGSAVDQTVARVRGDGSESVIHLGSPPSAIAAGVGSVWVASDETGTLFRVEPRTGTVAKAIRVGNRPVAVAAGESGV